MKLFSLLCILFLQVTLIAQDLESKSDCDTELHFSAKKINGTYISALLDRNENLITDYKFQSLQTTSICGILKFKENSKWGLIDTSGNIIMTPIETNKLTCRNGIVVIEDLHSKKNLLNVQGDTLVNIDFDEIIPTRYKPTIIWAKVNSTWQIYNAKGVLLSEHLFKSYSRFIKAADVKFAWIAKNIDDSSTIVKIKSNSMILEDYLEVDEAEKYGTTIIYTMLPNENNQIFKKLGYNYGRVETMPDYIEICVSLNCLYEFSSQVPQIEKHEKSTIAFGIRSDYSVDKINKKGEITRISN